MDSGQPMSSSTLFTAAHPLVPLATFDVSNGRVAAIEEKCSTPTPSGSDELALLDHVGAGGAVGSDVSPAAVATPSEVAWPAAKTPAPSTSYELFPPEASGHMHCNAESMGQMAAAPDFLGRLHHLKTLFRMSATKDPVSVMIHRAGPLLILDDGPCGWSRGDSEVSQPLPPLSGANGVPDGASAGGPNVHSVPGGMPIEPPPGLEPPDSESQLMLAALDRSLEMALVGHQYQAPGTEAIAESVAMAALPEDLAAAQRSQGSLQLPEVPSPGLRPRLFVKNTFLDIKDSNEEDDDEEPELARTRSAPGRMGATTPTTPPLSGDGEPGQQATDLPPDVPGSAAHQAVCQRLREHAERAANSWSLIPYQPEAGETGRVVPVSAESKEGSPSDILGARQWDLLQFTSPKKATHGYSDHALEVVQSLFSGIPPQPSRFGRAHEWRCGPYKVLLGCDLVVLRSDDRCDQLSDYASFKMLPPGSSREPSREERLDVYLENLMCDISRVAWASPHQGGQTTWRVFDTTELPAPTSGEGFDAKLLQDQGQRLLHFLRQKCHREGGTYWLFREQSSPAAELFDLSGLTDPAADDSEPWKSTSRAFCTKASLALPIARLCFHLAKSLPTNADQRQLLQKGLHLLEPFREEHAALYSATALELASSYMRTSMAAIPDGSADASKAQAPRQHPSVAEPPVAARLAVALRYLEGIHKLLASLEAEDTARDEVTLLAELHLQAHVAYAECVVKLTREAIIPTYSAWLAEVQRVSRELLQMQGSTGNSVLHDLGQTKRLSAAFLLWRLFWLVRAQRALAVLPPEKRETECWTLDRDLCEITADALYGLSRYPADDVGDLLGGHMKTAEGICMLVEEGLRTWGLRAGGGASAPVTPSTAGRGSRKKQHKRLTSPQPAAAAVEEPPQEASKVTAMFLSKLNPLARGTADEALRDDPLVRDDLRPALWSEGRALRQCLHLYERATARLRKAPPLGGDDESSQRPGQQRRREEDQATLKVARKLAHLYNEEARTALVQARGGHGTEEAEELLQQAHRWMMLSGDLSNAGRVLLNLGELHARRAERATEQQGEDETGAGALFTEAQYQLFLKAVECAEEAARLSDNTLGRREGAFAHLRLGVHLSVRVPVQRCLAESRRNEVLAELADRHFGKALHAFDELREEREVAVCHFHMADLALQEQQAPGAQPVSRARLASALRHARRSADYWEKVGALEYVKDFIAAHIRIARLLASQQQRSGGRGSSSGDGIAAGALGSGSGGGGTVEALEHIAEVEARLLGLAQGAKGSSSSSSSKLMPETQEFFVFGTGQGTTQAAREACSKPGQPLAVTALRREMGNICQAGLRRGEDVERLKAVYRRVLRNEPLGLGKT